MCSGAAALAAMWASAGVLGLEERSIDGVASVVAVSLDASGVVDSNVVFRAVLSGWKELWSWSAMDKTAPGSSTRSLHQSAETPIFRRQRILPPEAGM